MIFLGGTFAGGLNSLDAMATVEKDLDSIIISNVTCEELYATSQELTYSTTIPSVWDIYTLLHATFDGNLLAGNVGFYVSEVSCLRLKRRVKGYPNWVTLYEQTVQSSEDLIVEWFDWTARSNTTYEYTIAPVFDTVEGTFFTNLITTDFHGLFIVDKDNVFSTELDVIISEKRNKPRVVIPTINRKYPFVISNGSNNYDSGTCSAQWLEYDSTDDSWDVDGARNFVHNFKDFLSSGSGKLLKVEDGRMWLIEVSSSDIVDSEDDRHLQVHTSFEWTEIGDCDSGKDLYDNNLIDVRGD